MSVRRGTATGDGDGLRLLHVVATARRRGAELSALDLMGALPERIDQRVAVLRGGGSDDLAYPARTDVLSGAGWETARRFDPAVARRLSRLVRTLAPDVVLAHGGDPLKYLATALLRGSPPVVYRRIGATPHWMAGRSRRSAYGLLIRRATRVIAVAEAMRRQLVDGSGVQTDRVVVIPNGVDPERVRPARGRAATRSELGLADDAPVILSLGALTGEKDPLTVVRVAAEVVRAVPEARHLLVGEGPLRSETQTEAARLGLGDRLLMLGPRSDVGDLLAAADLLLLPSRTEGLPAVAVEAGLAGLPVVASRVGGVPEVVERDVTGLLVEPGDVAGFVAAVAGLLGEPDRRRALGEAAAVRCREGFSIERLAPRWVEVLDAVGGREGAGMAWAGGRR
jgi:glycosyltransferase involved in cell wall biosynthesis